MKKEFKIGNKMVGEGHPAIIIAEMSGNHRGDFETAKKMVKTACECGADVIKLQTFKPDALTLKSSKKWFQVKVNEAWKGKTLYDLYQEVYTPWEWQPKLQKIAQVYGVPLFSTASSPEAIAFLNKMKVSAFKIPSFELTDTELLKEIAKTKKPVILSRGMASLAELKQAISILKNNGNPEVAILHCISSYPAKPEEMNLLTIPDMKKRFKTIVGLSDHSLSIIPAVVAVVLGASIIEKHFILKRRLGGPDAGFSLEPEEFKQMAQAVREVERALGKARYGVSKSEKENIIFRRSIFAVEDIKASNVFTKKNIRSIRPGYGLKPECFPKVLGKKARKDIEAGTPLSWNLIKK